MAEGVVARRVRKERDENGEVCATYLVETVATVEVRDDGKVWATSEEREYPAFSRPEPENQEGE